MSYLGVAYQIACVVGFLIPVMRIGALMTQLPAGHICEDERREQNKQLYSTNMDFDQHNIQ